MLDDATKQYLHDLTPERDPVLRAMEDYAEERSFPIIGPLVGRILHQLTVLSRAVLVFEMGSGFGYSTVWFARALPPDGTVHWTDGSEDNYRMAAETFERAGIADRVRMTRGDAVEILAARRERFDIILNDIDKASYPDALPVALDRLATGGLLITDNILWQGKVVAGERDADTEGIRRYTRALYETPDLFTTVIPVRDGISISLKTA
jgi:predicted O-methyltransferase YrrM